MQERAELHKTIWKIANDLRGSVDGWEFKAYVLGSIFYGFNSYDLKKIAAKLKAQNLSLEMKIQYLPDKDKYIRLTG